MTDLQRAIDHIDARRISRTEYAYYDDDEGAVYVSDSDDLRDLGHRLRLNEPQAYSFWRAGTWPRRATTVERLRLATKCPVCASAGRLGYAPKGTRTIRGIPAPLWRLVRDRAGSDLPSVLLWLLRLYAEGRINPLADAPITSAMAASGGYARAASLTAEQRSAAAKIAARARWHK